ncbi:MAG: type IX secretion system protein PorQ [Paludibacteraceae bacterium]|nr:type IX secretion system protein PorQ [Paludibacteraceae bacterium]
MKKTIFQYTVFLFISCIICLPSISLYAQVYGAGSSVYSFMGLPVSSRLAALGGEQVAIQDGEITSALLNPSLLSGSTHHALSLNYSYHLKGTMGGVAMYGYNFRRSKIEKQLEEDDRPNRFAIAVHYMDYGSMLYASEQGELTGGKFTAKDILIDAVYARQLGEMFSVGVGLKPVMSFYESYSSFALAADVGGHFQTRDSALHIGLTFRNIGWQLKGFYSLEGGQQREQLPFNIEVGLSYRVKHAPLRFSVTIHNLQRWDLKHEFTNQPSDTKGKVEWYDMMFRHTVFALDIVPKSEKFYLTLSYNHRRRAEMQLKDQRSLAGFALGGGVRIKMLRFGFALSQATKSNLTYHASLSFDINKMLK